jgi:branched-chain amino acid transport system permease protein
MAYFFQQTINGIALGAIYGLIALGYTMVYGIVGMINFAHGEIFMVGAFISLIAFTVLGLIGITWAPLAIVLVLILATGLTAVYGWAVERVAYRPLRGSTRLAPLISAIGASIFLQNYVQLLQGARTRTLPALLSGSFELMSQHDFTVRITAIQILIILLTLALMFGLVRIVERTRFGRSQRACEQDMDMAAMAGINVDRTISLTFVVGAALAATAGLMETLYYGTIDFFMGFLVGIKAFTAAVLGGIGSIPGAMLGGLLIGLVEAYWAGYVSGAYKDVSVFVVLILILTVLPTGLLGRPHLQKV